MDSDAESPVDSSKKIILIVGVVAVVLAAILFVVFAPPDEPEVDPYVIQLEQEVAVYTGQIDSLNAVVDGLDGRLDVIRTQMDSARTVNQTLLASLHRVTKKMQEWQGLYQEQQELNRKLVSELKQAKAEKGRALSQVKQLRTEVDSLNNELYTQTVRLVRLESSLEEAMGQARRMEETVTSVLVCVGTADELQRLGYLKTGRGFFRKSYKAIGFPDVTDASQSDAVLRISLGETLALQGELETLADRHGKLDKGKEYEVSKGPPGQNLITFIDPTLQGQRVLAVLKAPK